MAIKMKINEIAKERGIKNSYQLGKKAKLPPTSASRLFRNKASQINLKTLDKLCIALNCQPGDLFVKEI